MAQMISFLAGTWFIWWIVAIVLVLRWFHVVSVASGESEAYAANDNTPAAQLPSVRYS
jgi:hypothetical protein